jgi:high-affinity Fe2+/Pb2+ permease
MSNYVTIKRKLVPSEHQKQIRFITGLSMVAGGLFAFVFFWYLSRSGFAIATR